MQTPSGSFFKNVIALRILVAFFAAGSTSAYGADTGAKISQGLKAIFRVRTGLGYGFSRIKQTEPATVQDFDRPRTFWQEADVLAPISLHLGLRETYDDSTRVDFEGQGEKRGELYLTTLSLGAKFTLPAYMVQPWAGAGIVGGFLAVTNPANRGNDNIGVIFDRETRAIRGAYWHAGVDLMFGDVGLRIGYRSEKISTDAYHNLTGEKMKFIHDVVTAGLVAYVN